MQLGWWFPSRYLYVRNQPTKILKERGRESLNVSLAVSRMVHYIYVHFLFDFSSAQIHPETTWRGMFFHDGFPIFRPGN